MELLVIDDAELPGSHALHPSVGVYHVGTLARLLQTTLEIVGRMPYLKGDLLRKLATLGRQIMEVMDGELLAMRPDRLVALDDIEDVLDDILLHHVPRTATQSQPLRWPMVWNQWPWCFPTTFPVSISTTSPSHSPK